MKKQSLGLWSKSLGNSNTKGYTEVGETLLNSSHRVKMLKYHTGRQKKTIHISDLNNRRQESIILVFPELQSLHNKNLSAEHWKLQNLGELGDGNDQSVQFSHSVVSDSLWPHELQHARLSCPSPTPGAYSNSCLSSRWCHPTISSSVIPFSSLLESFPASGSFQMSQFFTSCGQSVGVSGSASVLSTKKKGLLCDLSLTLLYLTLQTG